MKWTIVSATLCFCALCTGAVTVSVCNPTTLELYPMDEVMVGMNVAIVVDSNSPDLWSGSLFLEGEDREFGSLLGRDRDPNSRDWMGSHLPAAGQGALALEWKDSLRWGFDFYTDDVTRQAGKWFVVDYRALQPGSCTVAFYDHSLSWTVPDPNNSITFTNSPTRDLVPDGMVNFADFSLFSQQWNVHTGISDPNLLSPADFNQDGDVDVLDLCMFGDYWMFGVPGWEPSEHSILPTETCPYILYRMQSAEGLSEIDLEVGQSVVLYIEKESCGEDTFVIDLEAQISDPNLGWIDNTIIDPNNPDGGTAHILFTPRDTGFDYWGPGQIHSERIEFIAASLYQSIADGEMACFLYTATAPGIVELNVADYISQSGSEPVIIHQHEAELQMQDTLDLTAAASSVQEIETVTESQPQNLTSEQVAEVLEELRTVEPELQGSMNEAEWDEFIEVIKNSN